MKIDAATTTATDYCYSLKLILQKQQPKNQKQQPTNKQTKNQEELRIYSSRKKKNEAKTNLELHFSSELLFCSVLFCSLVFYFFLFLLLYSVGLPSLLLSPQLLAIQKSKNSKGIVVSVNRRPWNSNALSFSLFPQHKTTGNWTLEALREAPSTERANGAWKTFLGEKTRSEEGKSRMAMAMAMVFFLFFFFFFLFLLFFFFFKGLKMQGITFMANS